MGPAHLLLCWRLGQSFSGELPDRLVHPEPVRAVVVAASPEQALVEQCLEGRHVGCADGLRARQHATAPEYRKPVEQRPFAVVEQVVRPRDRGS